ncbi:MAG: alpha/beta hydrolase [Simkania sp.]|nr:alpha/beta hydrolase [Simkania sp.]
MGLDFSSLPRRYGHPPSLLSYTARDGVKLSYRCYDSSKRDKVVILLHGSSSHGEYLHSLAERLKTTVGQVFVPNLRGHYASGIVSGDCSYIGQLEDDLCDLIKRFSLQDKKIYFIGHSSGGGLAIRFMGGIYGNLVRGVVLLSPAIPTAPTMRGGTAGGWAKLSYWKIILLSILNALGIRFLNHMKVIQFNLPKAYCNGKETLSYSFNLNSSYHPRLPYHKDISSLKGKSLVIIGSKDEANDPALYPDVMQDPDSTSIRIIDGVKHLDVVQNATVVDVSADWINKHI